MPDQSLRGRRLAIPAHAELDRLAEMLQGNGAAVVRFPLMAILDAPDRQPIEDWLRALATDCFDDVVFLTGQGVTRLMAAADGCGLTAEVLEALARVRKITRGPKPARTLYELGQSVDVAAPTATVQGVIDCFRGRLLGGRRIGVQLFGDDGGDEILRFLRAKGAFVHEVAPYRYEPAANPDEVASFIEEIARDQYAAITFTTPMQVDRLFEVALRKGIETLLRVGLAGAQVVAVGRETRSALQAHDVSVDISPPRQFWMRHLVAALLARLGSSDQATAPGVTQG